MLSVAYQTPTTHSLDPIPLVYTLDIELKNDTKDAFASTSAKFVTKARSGDCETIEERRSKTISLCLYWHG